MTKRKQGAYYLKKSIDYWKKLGWKTEKLEVSIPFFIKGRAIFSRKDLLGADIIIWKGKEVKLVQVKSTTAVDWKAQISWHRSMAKKEFADIPLPKMIMIWQPRTKPIIEELG